MMMMKTAWKRARQEVKKMISSFQGREVKKTTFQEYIKSAEAEREY